MEPPGAVPPATLRSTGEQRPLAGRAAVREVTAQRRDYGRRQRDRVRTRSLVGGDAGPFNYSLKM